MHLHLSDKIRHLTRSLLVAADVDAEGEDGEEQDEHDQAQDPDQGPVGGWGGGVQGPGHHPLAEPTKADYLVITSKWAKKLGIIDPPILMAECYWSENNSLWRIVFSYVNIFIRNMCLANYGASEAVYPCNVVEKIHEYFRSKMRQCL
jgi:hypothetical protein